MIPLDIEEVYDHRTRHINIKRNKYILDMTRLIQFEERGYNCYTGLRHEEIRPGEAKAFCLGTANRESGCCLIQ